MNENSRKNKNGNYNVLNTNSWPPERWVAVVVIAALGMLILIRRGFRGVDFMGARLSVN